MNLIDTDNLTEVDKVERYIDLVQSFRKISKTISDEGETVTTINASQSFTKAHPLITERSKVNASLIALEKAFQFKPQPTANNANTSTYKESDLV